MRRDFLRPGILVTASAVAGLIGWSGHALLLPAAVAFPAFWSLTRSRGQAAVVSAAYFLAASRGLPQGVATFYASDIWPGLLLWLVASSSFVTVHAVLWTDPGGWEKILRYLGACVTMAIPPFGIMGWAHPITAAGILFPAWGWWGLAAMAAGLGIMATRRRPAAAMAMTGLWLWSAAGWTTPVLPASWIGVDLQIGASLGRDAGRERQHALIDVALGRPTGTTVVLPESALGFWTPTIARLWHAKLGATNITVIAGAAIVDDGGYDNVLVKISQEGSAVLYRERMPVPGSMWQPWRRVLRGGHGGARAHFFANPVVEVGSLKAAPLICYEQLLIWPILQSALYRPDAIVAVGNGWWTSGTSIIDIQRASSEAWARLFDLPLVISFNS
ncbi:MULTISPECIES: conjugal transfer protein TraB [unclassified Rhizobium]|uniref:conjugal transfer protein TraB n=1 Tax=unclassified Rhizobium TaxID=2613769 RepID=UPI0006F5CBF8|nr:MULTISPECIES: conjugal transfer protein TraB [unclassified Rhizobium]KQV39920.1 conjugal transfer protein TraB [Rhizobium sp. Root1212]KRD31630.1 conjugal transfer protein TraB [Rhizobium sp. Root268]